MLSPCLMIALIFKNIKAEQCFIVIKLDILSEEKTAHLFKFSPLALWVVASLVFGVVDIGMGRAVVVSVAVEFSFEEGPIFICRIDFYGIT
jgi:hypothetical protein